MAAHVLVVDDDPIERRRIEDILKKQGHTVESAASGEAALARVEESKAAPISAMILDLVMPDLDGMAVLERLSRRASAVPVIAQTSPGGIDAGASAMRIGALDFLVKPAEPERIRASLANALKVSALEQEVLKMRLGRSGTLGLDDIAMRSPSMERVRQLAERAARSSIPVLIEGERGVGKEFLARAIHASSARRGRPFVCLRCDDAGTDAGALLFDGDANAARPGASISAAGGGTLFLDEIGSLASAGQAALSDMLAGEQTGKPHALPGDVRLVATSGRRLIDLIAERGFSEALFHRLNVLPIWVPPLRERRADIADLARRFLVRITAEAGRSDIAAISDAAMRLLMQHDWPGNIRELERTIFRAVMFADSGELQPGDLPSLGGQRRSTNPNADQNDVRAAAEWQRAVADQGQSAAEPAAAHAPRTDSRGMARYGVARLLDERGEMRPFEVLEQEVIRFAIDHYGGRMSEVARRLGIGRSTLYRKIKDYGIAPESIAS